jgi:hypothetical protein
MQIEKVPFVEKYVFKPIAIQIVIESKEELEVLRKLSEYDLSVPNMLYSAPESKEKRKMLEEFLGNFRKQL